MTADKAAVLVRYASLPNVPAKEDSERFEARLQNDVIRALCRNAATRPGDYRVAIDLWVGLSGRVERVAFLGSTGDDDRDKQIARMLEGLRSVSPPSGMAQPTTLLLVPKASASNHACDVFQPALDKAGAP